MRVPFILALASFQMFNVESQDVALPAHSWYIFSTIHNFLEQVN